MRKIDYITGLYRETLDDITASAENWMSFLHSAAYQYKYPFADQVLIYAQRPQATACAGIELWNQRFGRWVNRGATGIALIREENGKTCLAHVFDVLDTHHRENRGFDIWRFKPEYEADVMEALQNRFILDDKTRENVSDTVIAASIALGADHIQDYLKELQAAKEGSYLEELDENHLRMKLLMTVQASVSYLVLTRIGLDADNIEALIQSIEDSYASWKRYMTEGGSDPFWADGVNMNLLCNHIISYRKQLEEMCVNGERPDILNRELPPEMPDNYMARADEIREAAGKTLEVYKSNPTYLWCREQAKRMPDKLLKKSVIPNILGYVTGLEASIKNDDLVSMRRHRDPERYIGSFDTCRKEIEKLLPQIERE